MGTAFAQVYPTPGIGVVKPTFNQHIPLGGSKTNTWTDPVYVGNWSLDSIVVPTDIAGNTKCQGTNCPAIADLFLNHYVDGGSSGARVNLWANLAVIGTTVDYPNSQYFQPAYFTAYASANQGGTGTGLSQSFGNIFGMGVNVGLRAGATDWATIDGAELDVAINSGASASQREGVAVVAYGANQVTSAVTNAVTASGSAVLNFASVPAAVATGQLVIDATDASQPIVNNSYVVSKTTTTVTISQNVGGTGVTSGATITFNNQLPAAITDAGFSVSGLGNWDAPWVVGLAFTSSHGAWGVDNCGALIAAPPGTGYTYAPCGTATDHKALYGIDFRNVVTPNILQANSGANNNFYIGNDSTNTAYNIVSMNGQSGTATNIGMAGGASGDNNLYLDANGGSIIALIAGQQVFGVSSSGIITTTTGNYAVAGSNTLNATPSNPTGVAGTSGKVLGLNQTMTPHTTGNLRITINGDMASSSTSGTSTTQIYYGTGTAPTNGTACTSAGTTRTALGSAVTVYANATTNAQNFGLNGIAKGLTLGTAYWIDLCVTSGANGTTATGTNLTVTANEQ